MAVRAADATGLGAGTKCFIDDRLDGPSAAAAFGSGSETSIDLLGMAHRIAGVSDGGADIVVAEDVAGTDDHESGRPFGDAPSSIFEGSAGRKRKNRCLKIFQ